MPGNSGSDRHRVAGPGAASAGMRSDHRYRPQNLTLLVACDFRNGKPCGHMFAVKTSWCTREERHGSDDVASSVRERRNANCQLTDNRVGLRGDRIVPALRTQGVQRRPNVRACCTDARGEAQGSQGRRHAVLPSVFRFGGPQRARPGCHQNRGIRHSCATVRYIDPERGLRVHLEAGMPKTWAETGRISGSCAPERKHYDPEYRTVDDPFPVRSSRCPNVRFRSVKAVSCTLVADFAPFVRVRSPEVGRR